MNFFSPSLLLCLSLLVLLVCSHEGREDAVLLVQQHLGPVVLQDDPALHHNHQVGVEDGVDAMLRRNKQKKAWSHLILGYTQHLIYQSGDSLTAIVTTVRSAKAVITTFCRMLSCEDREKKDE